MSFLTIKRGSVEDISQGSRSLSPTTPLLGKFQVTDGSCVMPRDHSSINDESAEGESRRSDYIIELPDIAFVDPSQVEITPSSSPEQVRRGFWVGASICCCCLVVMAAVLITVTLVLVVFVKPKGQFKFGPGP